MDLFSVVGIFALSEMECCDCFQQ